MKKIEHKNKIKSQYLKKDKTMKHLLTLIGLFAILLFSGCNEQTEINSPVAERDYKLISLPTPTGLTVESIFTQNMVIDGDIGATFPAEFSYESGPDELVTINSNLNFLAGAFAGTVDITQSFNTESAAVNFGPSMQFSVAVQYTLTISGVDLTDVNPSTLDFVYIAEDGTIYDCEYESVSMDLSTGTLTVVNAELHHFSRYGFVN